MLAASLFFVAVIALASGVVLEGSLGFARASAKHAAQHYAESGLGQARAALLQDLAAQIASGASSLTPPPPMAATPACGTSSMTCPFTVAATFAFTGHVADSASPNVDATDLQTHPSILEGRVAATIVETVRARGGTALASRTEYLTVRTFALPPYVAVDGVTDAAGARDVSYEADAGGCDPSTPSACDANNRSAPASAPPAGSMTWNDTRIRALRQCIDDGSGVCSTQPYVSADPANIAPQTPWFNGNAQNGGWTR
ncbi:MAG: hypothetical protein ACRENA_02280 [Vulcanimicrobiaceae bacterium]